MNQQNTKSFNDESLIEEARSSAKASSDNAVIKRVMGGDVNAYQIIMRRYNQRLFRIARSILLDNDQAMDIVQEAHIKAYQKLSQFNGKTTFSAWLSVITKNEALMLLRKLKREALVPQDDNHSPYFINGDAMNNDSKEKSPDSVIENKQLLAQLNQHIDQLSDDFRMVFILRGVEQLSVRETADVLGLNQATVKTRYFRAKAMLQKQILDQYEQGNSDIYEFGGHHCDIIVANVMQYIHTQTQSLKT